MRRLSFSIFLVSSLAAATAMAAGVYPGANFFGAWASTSIAINDGTNPLVLNTTQSGPPQNGVPNGLLAASSDSGTIAGVAGQVSASGVAHAGFLGGAATASGCVTGLFQQPCDTSSATSEYLDQFHLTGAPDGTPIQVTFTLTTNGSVNGFGSWSIGSRAGDGFFQVDFSSSNEPGPVVNSIIHDTRSWTATYIVGTEYALTASLLVGTSEWNCPGGSEFCGVVNSIALDLTGSPPLSSSLSAALVVPNPSIRLVAASGYNYLPPPVVAVKGDVNGDGLVNCADLQLVKVAFNSRRGQASYNANADVNGDGVINIVDLSTVARALPVGTTCP
ncbi:MAG TPA: dockerin type I domain-containing protein [Steroidobacteraceae bacterium]|jgi:hypothetical protein